MTPSVRRRSCVLYLPDIPDLSLISPVHLPYICHASPLYLPYISLPGAAAELWRADGVGGFYSSYGSNYAYSTPVDVIKFLLYLAYVSPISPLYLPYISPISPL